MPFEVNTFNVAEPAPVIVGGLKLALEAAGRPLIPKFTVPVKPLVALTVSVKFVLPPASTGCEGGAADKERSLTNAVNDRLFVNTPSVTERVMSDEPVA